MNEALKHLKELIDNSRLTYDGFDDEVGSCSYCGSISYERHNDACELLLAAKFLKAQGVDTVLLSCDERKRTEG